MKRDYEVFIPLFNPLYYFADLPLKKANLIPKKANSLPKKANSLPKKANPLPKKTTYFAGYCSFS